MISELRDNERGLFTIIRKFISSQRQFTHPLKIRNAGSSQRRHFISIGISFL